MTRAGDLDDLHVYDPAGMAWTNLSSPLSGQPPTSRDSHGFASAGGRLFVYGGATFNWTSGYYGEDASPNNGRPVPGIMRL